MPRPPAQIAENASQLASLAELRQSKKWALFERSEGDRSVYHQVSCRPITKKAEDDMELLSDIFTWGEEYLNHWESGLYLCSRCDNVLFSSVDKWRGPCVWPSFRCGYQTESNSNTTLDLVEVYPYNKYSVTVKEVYCAQCDLFVGHGFQDGIEKGDVSPHATGWRF
jgi:peptide-methionine (R)-S-oxide reductase